MGRPLIWAHRGADKYAPENTLPAFEMAVQMGADGVELDVQLSKDGHVVVCHDERLERVSNAGGWVKDYTLEELKRMDFSNGQEEFAGVQIPTLAEVLDLLQDTRAFVDIELKTQVVPYASMARKVLDLVEEKGYEERTIFCSFNHLTIDKIRLLAPWAKTGYLYLHANSTVVPIAKKLGIDAVHITQHDLDSKGFLEKCQECDMQINVWTVNKEEEMRHCMEVGVNAVITDYPYQMKQVRDQ